MKIRLQSIVVILVFFFSCTTQDDADKDEIIPQRITSNEGFNNAFTDLIFFDSKWFISYRESDKHVLGRDGIVKILSSPDGGNWKLVKEFKVDRFDLRNASFTIEGNKLTAYLHGSEYINSKLISFRDFRSTYSVDRGWQDLESVFLDKKEGYISKIEGNQAWPWQVIYYKDQFYSFAYGIEGLFDLYKSSDGLQFSPTNFVKAFEGQSTETKLKVDKNGVFFALVRRDNSTARLGKSNNFGNSWDWFGEIPIYDFGGPDFVFYKKGILLSGRESNKTILGYYNFEINTYKKLKELKSSGDCSYAGMIIKDGFLWMSYYSAHANKKGTSIYFSKINLEKLSL